MPYPNQPEDVSDQSMRVATNIVSMLDRNGMTLGSAITVAWYLDQEFGKVPDQNLLYQVASLEKELAELRIAVETQLATMNPRREL